MIYTGTTIQDKNEKWGYSITSKYTKDSESVKLEEECLAKYDNEHDAKVALKKILDKLLGV